MLLVLENIKQMIRLCWIRWARALLDWQRKPGGILTNQAERAESANHLQVSGTARNR